MTTKNRPNSQPVRRPENTVTPPQPAERARPTTTEVTGISYRVTDRNAAYLSFGGKNYKVNDGMIRISAAEAEPFVKAGFLVESSSEGSKQARLIDEAA